MKHLKTYQFKQQIRRKQKEELLANLRAQFQQGLENLANQQQSAFIEQWEEYIKKPEHFVPSNSIKYFTCIDFNTHQSRIENTINSILQPTDSLNINFTLLCIEVYGIKANNFFNKMSKTVDNKQINQTTRIQLCQYDKTITYSFVQQVYLNFFSLYFSHIKQDDLLSIECVAPFKDLFVRFWDERYDSGLINNRICAEVGEKFIYFMDVFGELKDLIKEITFYFVKCTSELCPGVYYFMKRRICECWKETCVSNIILLPQFNNFLLLGLQNETCIKPVLLIIQALFQKQQTQKVLQKWIQINDILRSLLQIFYSTNNRQIQVDLLSVLYNIVFSRVETIQNWVSFIDFQRLSSCCVGGALWDVFDLGLAVLYNYPSLQNIKTVLYSNKFKLLQQCNTLIFKVFASRAWKFLEDLLETLQVCVPILLESILKNRSKELMQIWLHIEQLVINTITKLNDTQWNQNYESKQDLINRFEQLLKQNKEVIE